MCLLDFAFVTAAATSAMQLAQTFVHEGAHARLDRAGPQFSNRAQRERERQVLEALGLVGRLAYRVSQVVRRAV